MAVPCSAQACTAPALTVARPKITTSDTWARGRSSSVSALARDLQDPAVFGQIHVGLEHVKRSHYAPFQRGKRLRVSVGWQLSRTLQPRHLFGLSITGG